MRKLPGILAFLLLVTACREPRSMETFIQGSGPYTFTVDMSDTTAVYDLALYTRIDVSSAEIPQHTTLAARWTSPSGAVLQETLTLPLAAGVYEPYRAGVSPYEAGIWTLTFTLPLPPDGIRGLGLEVKRVSKNN